MKRCSKCRVRLVNQAVMCPRCKTRQSEPFWPQESIYPTDLTELAGMVKDCVESIDIYSLKQVLNSNSDLVPEIDFINKHGVLPGHFAEDYKVLCDQFGKTLVDQYLNPKRRLSSGSKRAEFLDSFSDRLRRVKFPVASGNNSETISTRQLLGECRERFKQAIAEEVDSEYFRRAVVRHGISEYESTGETLSDLWTRPTHLVVGGPSGAGKTFSAKRIIRALDLCLRVEQTIKNGNIYVTPVLTGGEGPVKKIVSVDGGDARVVSQMRSIVLQVALALGYKGVKDLAEVTGKMDFKEMIRSFAFEAGVHVVEPRTFATRDEKYEYILRMPERAIFAQVRAPKDLIKAQGDRRAWYDKSYRTGGIRLIPIDPNNREIGCESKIYSAGGPTKLGISRRMGKWQSQRAAKKFIQSKRSVQSDDSNMPEPRITVEYINRGRVSGDDIHYDLPCYTWIYFGARKFKLGNSKITNPLKKADDAILLRKGEKLVEEPGRNGWSVLRFPEAYCVIFWPS